MAPSTASTLYEAIAQALPIFRDSDWVSYIGRGQTSVTGVVKQPEIDASFPPAVLGIHLIAH